MDKDWSEERVSTLQELAKSLECDWKQGMAKADEFLDVWDDIVSIVPEDNPGRYSLLSQATEDIEAALASTTEPSDRLSILKSLGNIHTELCYYNNRISDVATGKQIQIFKEMVALSPSASDSWALAHFNLGFAYGICYRRHGKLPDLDSAIKHSLEGLSGPFRATTLRPTIIFRVGKWLFERFEATGVLQDLSQAIINFEASVDENGVEEWEVFQCLGGALASRSTVSRNVIDIEVAVELRRVAVELIPPVHPAFASFLSNLGLSLHQRYEALHNMDDLQQAIRYHQKALKLQPPPHTAVMIHNRLGGTLFDRFQCTFTENNIPDCKDWMDAVSHLTEATVAFPGTPDLAIFQMNLAKVLTYVPPNLVKRPPAIGSNMDGIKLLRQVVIRETAGPSLRFESAIRWAQFEHQHDRYSSALDGYLAAIELLPLLGWNGLAGRSRAESNTRLVWLSCDAASCAIQLNLLEKAIEISEHVRSHFWSGLSKFRIDIAELLKKDRALAQTLSDLGQKLEKASFLEQITGNMVSGGALRLGAIDVKSEEKASMYHQLSEDWNNCLEEVRKIDGYQQFLKQRPFGNLQHAASAGPIVVLIAGNFHSDALIVREGQDIKRVPLEKITGAEAAKIVMELHNEVVKKKRDWALQHILRRIWNDICEPVLRELDTTGPKKRIWWCPTGQLSFLPLHAAGDYNKKNKPKQSKSVPQKVISSYTISLGRLLDSRSQSSSSPSISSFLFANNGQKPEYASEFEALNFVSDEMQAINEVLGSSKRATFLNDCTPSSVLSELDTHNHIHFSCHGKQNQVNPLWSSLLLVDEPLTLYRLLDYQISELRSRPNLELAYLSACETATGSGYLSDQATHLAAGMQFIGFKRVIATLWPMQDKFSISVSGHFYKLLTKLSAESEDGAISWDAGVALHEALSEAIKGDSTNLWGWVPYIHIGV
ncbi:hypothetical protein GYMLUDRAFT_247379 [Collybiopsis luxurians FD-317 M1]|uniref:Unplaced genomic scaffold GYMLUscaffold_45, whole genome shotgun sequence n=1 Tax=Collybiopsis luxurians FD-317 M1 TaxID=944289 RepID=A0A0D0BPX0_9AGAR|nr:hypothetical protein GYMLUDRAFT_247379 [Collybiopsis luxurians FD-317 M1]